MRAAPTRTSARCWRGCSAGGWPDLQVRRAVPGCRDRLSLPRLATGLGVSDSPWVRELTAVGALSCSASPNPCTVGPGIVSGFVRLRRPALCRPHLDGRTLPAKARRFVGGVTFHEGSKPARYPYPAGRLQTPGTPIYSVDVGGGYEDDLTLPEQHAPCALGRARRKSRRGAQGILTALAPRSSRWRCGCTRRSRPTGWCFSQDLPGGSGGPGPEAWVSVWDEEPFERRSQGQ